MALEKGGTILKFNKLLSDFGGTRVDFDGFLVDRCN
jgi:hypothetical protein